MVGTARICPHLFVLCLLFSARCFAVHPTYAQFESVEGLRGVCIPTLRLPLFQDFHPQYPPLHCPILHLLPLSPVSLGFLLDSQPPHTAWRFQPISPQCLQIIKKKNFRVYNCYIKSKASTIQATPLLPTLKPAGSSFIGEYWQTCLVDAVWHLLGSYSQHLASLSHSSSYHLKVGRKEELSLFPLYKSENL